MASLQPLLNDRFSYAHCPLLPGQIRLLRVHPELHENGQLQCVLEVASIEHSYTALSYTWGTPLHDTDIILNGGLFTVRRNLWDFLRVARCNYTCRLWIDALCINQTDIPEKNQHVKEMAKIYRGAESTLCWLGEPKLENPEMSILSQDVQAKIELLDFDEEVTKALAANQIPRAAAGGEPRGTSSPTPSSHMSPPSTNNESQRKRRYKSIGLATLEAMLVPHWSKLWDLESFGHVVFLLNHLLLHPYWERLWIVQEILLSRRKTLIFTRFRLSWPMIAEAMALLRFASETMSKQVIKLDFSLAGVWVMPPTMILCVISSLLHHSAVRRQRYHYAEELGLTCLSGRRYSRFQTRLATAFLRARPVHYIGWEAFRVRRRIVGTQAFYMLESDKPQASLKMVKSDFLKTLACYTRSLCADRRDGIYGLLSLSQNAGGLRVDYGLGVYELFFEACHCIASGGLDLLNHDVQLARSISYTWGLTALHLMSSLQIGPVDFVFGDARRRSFVMRVVHEMADSDALRYSTMLKVCVPPKAETIEGVALPPYHFHIKGRCRLCRRRVSFGLPKRSPLKMVVIQCHSTRPDASTARHIVLYGFDSYPDWVALADSDVGDTGDKDHLGCRELQHPSRSDSEEDYTITDFPSTILELINIHEVFGRRSAYQRTALRRAYRGQPDPWSRPSISRKSQSRTSSPGSLARATKSKPDADYGNGLGVRKRPRLQERGIELLERLCRVEDECGSVRYCRNI
jgi:hypothetical protein